MVPSHQRKKKSKTTPTHQTHSSHSHLRLPTVRTNPRSTHTFSRDTPHNPYLPLHPSIQLAPPLVEMPPLLPRGPIKPTRQTSSTEHSTHTSTSLIRTRDERHLRPTPKLSIAPCRPNDPSLLEPRSQLAMPWMKKKKRVEWSSPFLSSNGREKCDGLAKTNQGPDCLVGRCGRKTSCSSAVSRYGWRKVIVPFHSR